MTATTQGSAGFQNVVSSETAAGLASLSKIVLNFHRTPTEYFEWERMMVQGFMQRSLVVTGPALRSPFFEAGADYFECPTRNVDKLIDWLLDSSDGPAVAQEVVNHAYEKQSSTLTPKRVGRFILAVISKFDQGGEE